MKETPSVQRTDGRKTGKPTYATHRSVSSLRAGVKAPFAQGRVLLPHEITDRAIHRKVYGSAPIIIRSANWNLYTKMTFHLCK